MWIDYHKYSIVTNFTFLSLVVLTLVVIGIWITCLRYRILDIDIDKLYLERYLKMTNTMVANFCFN